MSCPSGYFPIPGDSSNCANSTNTSIVQKVCPVGLTLQPNGLCGTGSSTILQTAATYCGPQYATKNCAFVAQLTTALTPALGSESIPNTICAYQENNTQIACDPGCCSSNTAVTASLTATTTESSGFLARFPMWLIIVLLIVSSILVAGLVYFAVRKKIPSTNRYGPELLKRVGLRNNNSGLR